MNDPRLLATTVVAGAIVFLVVTGNDYEAVGGHTPPLADPGHHFVAAPSYRDLQQQPIWINRTWSSDLATLTAPDRPLTSRANPALERTRTRAYAGAPPVVPHAIDQRQPAACLSCHGDGRRIGDRLAPKISHEPFASCLQCHVEADGIRFGVDPRLQANHFRGAVEPGPGPRAWPGAPPQIPHGLDMRQDCRSCHGPLGTPALRTTHPERASCQQCHIPARVLGPMRP